MIPLTNRTRPKVRVHAKQDNDFERTYSVNNICTLGYVTLRCLTFRYVTFGHLQTGVLADLISPRQMSGGPNLLAYLVHQTFDASEFGPTLYPDDTTRRGFSSPTRICSAYVNLFQDYITYSAPGFFVSRTSLTA